MVGYTFCLTAMPQMVTVLVLWYGAGPYSRPWLQRHSSCFVPGTTEVIPVRCLPTLKLSL